MKKDSKNHAIILPNRSTDRIKKPKKKGEAEIYPDNRRKIEEGEILKLLKKSGKLKKEIIDEHDKL